MDKARVDIRIAAGHTVAGNGCTFQAKRLVLSGSTARRQNICDRVALTLLGGEGVWRCSIQSKRSPVHPSVEQQRTDLVSSVTLSN